MARVSETNQYDRRRDGSSAPTRQPRIAMLIRRNGTWREVAFELHSRSFPESGLATPPQEH